MKRRKICVSVLVLLLMLSSLQLTAFANDEQLTGGQALGETEKMSNIVFMAMPENLDCTELETLQDLEAKLVLTKDADPAITAELPLMYEKELGGLIGEAYVEGDAMKTIIADLTANQEQYGELLDLDDLNLNELLEEGEDVLSEDSSTLSKKQMVKKLSETLEEAVEEFNIFDGYTVTVEGLPEHFTVQHMGVVITGDMLLDVFDLLKNLMAELMEIPELKDAQTVQEVLDGFAKSMEYDDFQAMLVDFEMTAEEIAELDTAIAEIEEIFNQAKAGTFESILTDIGILQCTCPILEYYEIYHEYYQEVDGKRTLVKRVAENEDEWGFSNLTGESGSYIRAEDWIKCEYDGVTYDYVNSYDSMVTFDEEPNWEEDIVTEFQLGDYLFCSGLVLRYVHVEEPAAPVDEDLDAADEDDGTVSDDCDADDTESDVEAAPLTGDHTPIGLYVALLATAAVAIIVLVAYMKRKNQDKK